MQQALIVIDVQESFRARPYWQEDDVPAFIARTQALIDAAREQGAAIVQVLHVSEVDGPQGAFSLASGQVRTLEPLRIAPDAVFHKRVHSSLYGVDDKGQTLEAWLRAHGISELVICGIRTEQCCETTTRHASDAGFKVRFASDATLTFPMQHATGRSYSAAEIRERTELVLAGRFARIVAAASAFA